MGESEEGRGAAREPAGEPQGPRDDRVHIAVENTAHRLLQITASVLLPIPAEQGFRVITHPNNETIFHHLERCTQHTVKSDDGNGRVVVESEHVATWRLFAFSGRLKTRLLVEQDFNRLLSSFQLVRGRFSPLRVFGGRWEARPQPPERWAALHGGAASPSGQCCQLVLEQELQPEGWLPPPLGSLLRQLACRQLQSVFSDLQEEAKRINEGQPTLWAPPSPSGQQQQQEQR